ncbi:signal peptidase II [Acidocella aromatica]|uniref:Lipoprotein signal peptidase n=1 Tax=Acidocella aromatica TaxID=1303579 RepID=A0A840VKG7_9PROT|nr:signal peptidase II [Acidocella aromatica]MBB5372081.1 signal peptidase II [Acidocella aromatica]
MRRLAGFLVAALVLGVDQWSKYLVLNPLGLQDGHLLTVAPFLNLVLVWNHGITFGLFAGAGAKILLALIASVVVLALFTWMWRTQKWVVTLAVGAIAGGAIGNVIDRLRFGAVVDFLQAHLGGLYYPWVFNVGDSAIVCGVVALMLENLLQKPPVAANPGEG